MADVCISTVADRHALHVVYTSKMKKTVTQALQALARAIDDTVRRYFAARARRCGVSQQWAPRLDRILQTLQNIR
jgi:hypothetical protein